MTASTEPRGGFDLGWDPGEDGWGPAMNANLLRLSAIGFHPSVISKTTTAPPGSPIAGEGYIVPSGASGAWSSQAGKIAIWDGAAWGYTTPRDGFSVHIADADGVAIYNDGAWSADVLRPDRLATAYAHSQATSNAHAMAAITGLDAALAAKLPVDSPTVNSGKTTLAPATAGSASLNIPPRSAAVTSPVEGDVQSDGSNAILTGLGIFAGRTLGSLRGASDTFTAGSCVVLEDNYDAPTKGQAIQLGASNTLDGWAFLGGLGGAWTKMWQILPDGTISAPSLKATGLAADKIVKNGAGGLLSASSIIEDNGSIGAGSTNRNAFTRPVRFNEAGGVDTGSAYSNWIPSIFAPPSDDTAYNTVGDTYPGFVWMSRRSNALTLVDGDSTGPYRGRIRADRWVGVSAATISGTTTATSWFAAGTGDGTATIPANYMKIGRRVSIKGIVGTSSCVADSAPEIAIKIGSVTIATITKAFTIASGTPLRCKVDLYAYIDDTGAMNIVGDVEFNFLLGETQIYQYAIGFYSPAWDTTIARTVDITLKPYSSSETWHRALAVLEI